MVWCSLSSHQVLASHASMVCVSAIPLPIWLPTFVPRKVLEDGQLLWPLLKWKTWMGFQPWLLGPFEQGTSRCLI